MHSSSRHISSMYCGPQINIMTSPGNLLYMQNFRLKPRQWDQNLICFWACRSECLNSTTPPLKPSPSALTPSSTTIPPPLPWPPKHGKPPSPPAPKHLQPLQANKKVENSSSLGLYGTCILKKGSVSYYRNCENPREVLL